MTEQLDNELSEAFDKLGLAEEEQPYGDEAATEADDTTKDAQATDQATDEAGKVEDKPATEDKPAATDKPDVSEAAKTLAAARKAGQPDPNAPPAAAKEELLLPPGADGKTRVVDITKAPTSWRKEAAEKFATLPKELREEIHKREDDMHRGLAEYRSAADYARAVASEFEPYRAYMRAENLNEIGVIRELMSTAYTLRSGTAEAKAALMLQIGSHYGVDWNLAAQLVQRGAGGQPQGQPAPVADPRVTELLQREQSREAAETQRIAEQAQRDTAAFFSDPKNEFAPIVREDMARLIESGQASSLQDAYDKACWTNPAVRDRLITKQAAEKARQDAEKAANARNASTVNVSRRSTPAASVTPKVALDSELSSAYDRLFS